MLALIGWALLVIVASTFVVETAFVYCFAAKRLLDQGLLPRDFRLIAYFWLVVGFAADTVFNMTRGTLTFRELPRELLFSARVQRIVDRGTGWRREKALRWAAILNAVDPAHIKL